MPVKDYIAIARPDHWIKNVFMLPGAIIAALFMDIPFAKFAGNLFIGLASTCTIASANYVVNEWLDAEFDRFHPTKRFRPSVLGDIKGRYVFIEYTLLGATGLWLASIVSIPFVIMSLTFLMMGVVYNVKPLRTKDRAFLDVFSESINNPIRLTLGWYTVTSEIFPPSSLVISYWMGGAFLMAVKRFGEYRFISNLEAAGSYRRSFRYYTESSLLICSFFYAMSCALFLGVFLVKYRIELLLSFPFVALLFSWYLYLGFKTDSPVQYPERLFKERGFMLYCVLFVVLLITLLVVDLSFLKLLLLDAFIVK